MLAEVCAGSGICSPALGSDQSKHAQAYSPSELCALGKNGVGANSSPNKLKQFFSLERKAESCAIATLAS
jgi:pyruvate dehydrogenase complex dehydrogenase (E1) component